MCYEKRDPKIARECWERDQGGKKVAEYIEREAMIKRLEVTPILRCGIPTQVRDGVIDLVEKQSAADVAPVVHGHWNIRCETHHDTYTGETDENFYIECSECRRKVWDVDQMAAMNGEYRRLIADYPHCHCGARMDGE